VDKLRKSNDRLGSRSNSTSNLGTKEYSPATPEIPKGSVFDRLTDHNKYTGTHKERFDKEGKGRGSQGRLDDVGVKSLDKLVSRV
jgi:hypothetical protein